MHPHSYNFIYIFFSCSEMRASFRSNSFTASFCSYSVRLSRGHASLPSRFFLSCPLSVSPYSKCPFYQHLLQLQLRIPRTVPRQLTSLSPSCVRPGNYSNNCPFREVIIFGRINISSRLKFIVINHQASSLMLAKSQL